MVAHISEEVFAKVGRVEIRLVGWEEKVRVVLANLRSLTNISLGSKFRRIRPT